MQEHQTQTQVQHDLVTTVSLHTPAASLYFNGHGNAVET